MTGFSSLRRLRQIRGMARLQAVFGGWTVLGFAFLYLPILLLVVNSFNESRFGTTWEGFTLRWYVQLWENTRILRGVENSLAVALATTLLSVVLGTAAAWLFHRYRFRGEMAIGTLAYLPMVVPEIIMGISLLVFYKSVSWDLGYGTVVVAHTTFCIPFVMAAVQARLAGLDPALEEAALDLGATPLRAFVHVIVPYLLPAILSGGLMAFALSLDELIVTTFVKSAGTATLPVVVFGMAKKGLDPTINALSTVFIVVTVGLLLTSEWVKRIRQ